MNTPKTNKRWIYYRDTGGTSCSRQSGQHSGLYTTSRIDPTVRHGRGLRGQPRNRECDARLSHRVQASEGPTAQRTKFHATPVTHAGCESGQRGANLGGAQAAPLGSFVFPAVSGQSNRSNYFLLDGIDNTDQVFTTYAVAPILEDIQEFKVQSHSDEAQFGGVLGGIVNVVSKSGTNNFHGTAWEFFRNTVLDAKHPLKGVASKLEQNQFGANFGGPVISPILQRP